MRIDPSKSLFYLDTSGLNFFADNVKDSKFLAAMKHHLRFELYLSPITLWEVLLNSNSARRDYLIYWGQFNCSPHLLKSPTEIILSYLKANCPEKSRKGFFDSPYTDQQIGETWTNIHGKIDRTIPIDLDALNDRSKGIRLLSKQLKTIVHDMCITGNIDDPFHRAMEEALKNLGRTKPVSFENERLLKLALILLFFIICIGFELENRALREFWEGYELDDPFERLDYIVEHNPKILIRGPLIEMAKMAEVQVSTRNSRSRGLIHDCFHTIYSYYADNLITGDAHFKDLRDNNPHSSFERIVLTEEIIRIWQHATEIMKKS